MGLVMVEIDMHHLRPAGPPGRKHWEVQKVVPEKPAELRQILGKNALTRSTGVLCKQGRDAEAALIRDAVLPQLEAQINDVLKSLEPVYYHHIGIGRRGQINLLPGRLDPVENWQRHLGYLRAAVIRDNNGLDNWPLNARLQFPDGRVINSATMAIADAHEVVTFNSMLDNWTQLVAGDDHKRETGMRS